MPTRRPFPCATGLAAGADPLPTAPRALLATRAGRAPAGARGVYEA